MTKFALITVVFLVIFSSCKKDLEVIQPDPAPVATTNMSAMNVSPDFNWKTVNNVDTEIKAGITAVVYVRSMKGETYHKAFLTAGIPYKTLIPLPTYEKEVKIELGGQILTVPVENGRIVCNFN